MKVIDVSSWQERRAALVADGEIGQEFLAFLEEWATEAERHLHIIETGGALDHALAYVESKRGRAGSAFLGQMMAVLAEHWEHGPDLMKTMTPIERRLVEDVTLAKVAYEQQKAETHAGRNVDPDGDAQSGVPGMSPAGQATAEQGGEKSA